MLEERFVNNIIQTADEETEYSANTLTSCTVEEVSTTINCLRSRKASGSDTPNIPRITLFLYADDLAVLARRTNLHHSLKILSQMNVTEKWAEENHLTFSVEKSQVICYVRR